MKKAQRAYQVYQYTSPFLHTRCSPVKFPLSPQIVSDIQHLKYCFKQSLQSSRITLGLAAPQVGITHRFFVMPRNFKYQNAPPRVAFRFIRHLDVIINPKIIDYSSKKTWMGEGCLSVEGQRYNIERSNQIEVEYYDENEEIYRMKLEGVRARVFSHETDHLDGITIRDVKGAIKMEIKQNEEASVEKKI